MYSDSPLWSSGATGWGSAKFTAAEPLTYYLSWASGAAYAHLCWPKITLENIYLYIASTIHPSREWFAAREWPILVPSDRTSAPEILLKPMDSVYTTMWKILLKIPTNHKFFI